LSKDAETLSIMTHCKMTPCKRHMTLGSILLSEMPFSVKSYIALTFKERYLSKDSVTLSIMTLGRMTLSKETPFEKCKRLFNTKFQFT
jgi:hypothetical protein